MKKVKVLTFEDERIGFATGGIGLVINKQKPVNIEVIEVEDQIYKDVMSNPPDNLFKKDHWEKILLNKEKKDKK